MFGGRGEAKTWKQHKGVLTVVGTEIRFVRATEFARGNLNLSNCRYTHNVAFRLFLSVYRRKGKGPHPNKRRAETS